MLCRVHVSSREVQSFAIATNVVLVAGCHDECQSALSSTHNVTCDHSRSFHAILRSKLFCETFEIDALCRQRAALCEILAQCHVKHSRSSLCHFVFRDLVLTKADIAFQNREDYQFTCEFVFLLRLWISLM